jgi:glycosyltransferase involved in cell wall biosynthesis
MALLEAMACGVPAVASAVGGFPQINSHGDTGFLVSPGHARDISDAVLTLYRDSGTRQSISQNARTLAKTRYGVEEWISHLETVYQDLSNQGNQHDCRARRSSRAKLYSPNLLHGLFALFARG